MCYLNLLSREYNFQSKGTQNLRYDGNSKSTLSSFEGKDKVKFRENYEIQNKYN